MVQTIDKKDILYWYEIVKKADSSDLGHSEFCRINNIDYRTFKNKYVRIAYKSRTNPELYKKLIPLTRKFMNSSITKNEFLKHHDISGSDLSCMMSHLNYLDEIEKLKNENNNVEETMNFIQVPKIQTSVPIQKEPEIAEIVEKKNDVELIISKGVKVIVAPEVGADKLIRIIELLKDL